MNQIKSASSAVSDRLVQRNIALQFQGVRYPVADVSHAVEFYIDPGFMLELQQYPVSLGDREPLLPGNRNERSHRPRRHAEQRGVCIRGARRTLKLYLMTGFDHTADMTEVARQAERTASAVER